MSQNKIYLAAPSYNGWHRQEQMKAIVSSKASIYQPRGGSLLCHVFNQGWAEALNLRQSKGITHFAMLHADVVPIDDNWLQILEKEMEQVNADVISAVVPIKTGEGLTSTALHIPDHIVKRTSETGKVYECVDQFAARRLSMKEIFDLTETFTDENLLINTGCFLADIRGSWADSVNFQITSPIVRDWEGKWKAIVESEDWGFSRYLHDIKASVWATRKVKLYHVGENRFPNTEVWGSEETDPKWKAD